jgi:very-short-patch-repair endonuclease
MERTANDKVLKARALRRTASPTERRLWNSLKLRPEGLKFRRQHSLGPYFADFYCAAAHLVVEVDGAAHDMGRNPGRDERRDRWMRQQGIAVLRFNAEQVINDLDSVVRAITVECLRLLPLHQPSAGSPPHGLRPQGG